MNQVDDCFKGPRPMRACTDKVVYIAGPITGDLLGNLPPFFTAENRLREAGHTTFNPARVDGGRSARECIDLAMDNMGRHDWGWYMRRGLAGLVRCNSIALLPGWEDSRGARIEARLATDLGMDFVNADFGHVMVSPMATAAV